jgi:site-specific DNA-methyltransferase (adenine-specific)
MLNLIHGDCLEVMKTIPDASIDAIITDPPYGTTACKWDAVIPFEPMWKELNRVIKDNGAIVLFGSEPFSSYLRLSNIKQYKYDLYWQKQKPVNFLQLKKRFGKTTENIILFYSKQCTYNPQKTIINDIKKIKDKTQKGQGDSITSAIGFVARDYKDDGTRYPIDILKFKRVDESKIIHPTQKPIELIEYLIKTYTNENDTVLDFTMGSGTTGVACKNLNRNFIGIEKDDNYFKIANDRINNNLVEQKQESMV